MSREEILKKLNEIFCEVFDDDGIVISMTSSAKDIESWDSLAHLHIIMAVEKTFNIKFELSDISNLKNVGDLISAIFNKKN